MLILFLSSYTEFLITLVSDTPSVVQTLNLDLGLGFFIAFYSCCTSYQRAGGYKPWAKSKGTFYRWHLKRNFQHISCYARCDSCSWAKPVSITVHWMLSVLKFERPLWGGRWSLFEYLDVFLFTLITPTMSSDSLHNTRNTKSDQYDTYFGCWSHSAEVINSFA